MDGSLSRLSIPIAARDPHGWQNFDNYRITHQRRLEQHPFPDASRQHTLDFAADDPDKLVLRGRVYCHRNVILEVENEFQYWNIGRGGILQVRCYHFLYVGWVSGGHLALKYHNHHANPGEYIHRVYNAQTGQQTLYETLHRHQFPLFSEVLDELELITRPFAA